MKLPKELSDFFKRRRHALGSKRHWKKKFNNGELIGRELFENAPAKSSKKFMAWAVANGGIWDIAVDGIRMRRLCE